MVKRPAIITGATVVFCALLCSGIVFADDDASVDDVSIVVPTACTLSGTGTGTHTATINPGQYVADIGTTTLKALCNDANGFAIYATGYTGSVVGDTNSNKLVGQNTAETIVTGLATSGNTSNWAMKLATDPNATYPVTIESAPNTSGGSDASFSAYHVVPNEYTKVATRLQSTDVGTTATGSTLTTTYATYISAGQVGDTYNGKVIYTLVHPNDHATPVAPLLATDCPAKKICYAPNANDIDGSMESISSTKITKSPTAGVQTQTYNSVSSLSNITSNSNVQLIAPNYSRSGYGFAGWSTDYNATNSSIIYGPNQTITTATDGTGDADVSEHGLILYPVWIASTGSIQNWSGCSTLNQATYNSTTGKMNATLSSVTALTDQRDSNTYTVARLADGVCWMTENLRLNAEDTLGDNNKALAQGYGDATADNMGKFIGLADSENSNYTATSSATAPTNANSLYYAGVQSGTATIDIGQTNYAGFRIPRYNNNNTNRELTTSYNGNSDTNHYQWVGYGNYYNWSAALANTTHYSGPTATVNGKTSENVGTSICPLGWKLPYGRSTGNGATPGGFYYLNAQMSDTTDYQSLKIWRSFPNNFIYSGNILGASTSGRGNYGYYRTSTAYDNEFSYFFYMSGNSINAGDSGYRKYNGLSVRCIVDPE